MARRYKLERLEADGKDALAVLLRNVHTIAEAAMNRQRIWHRDGQEVGTAEPDFSTALKAQELAGKLIGILDKQGGDKELEQVKRDLVALLKRSKIQIVRETG